MAGRVVAALAGLTRASAARLAAQGAARGGQAGLRHESSAGPALREPTRRRAGLPGMPILPLVSGWQPPGLLSAAAGRVGGRNAGVRRAPGIANAEVLGHEGRGGGARRAAKKGKKAEQGDLCPPGALAGEPYPPINAPGRVSCGPHLSCGGDEYERGERATKDVGGAAR